MRLFERNKTKKNVGKNHQMMKNGRYPLIEEKILLPKIIENHEKKELLEYLQSNNVSIIYKIKKINDFYGNEVKPSNMLSGGLLDDWNFEI